MQVQGGQTPLISCDDRNVFSPRSSHNLFFQFQAHYRSSALVPELEAVSESGPLFLSGQIWRQFSSPLLFSSTNCPQMVSIICWLFDILFARCRCKGSFRSNALESAGTSFYLLLFESFEGQILDGISWEIDLQKKNYDLCLQSSFRG